ncbi:MAG: hypothetical protein AMK69_17015 [Nitrospira bacterium SG8_3]|nr:MAG: hypothetical protein AMK69_17015 [Nitrospira bacterium SG8_3]
MITVYEALKDLDDEAKGRVIEWVSGKLELVYAKRFRPESDMGPQGMEYEEKGLLDFASVAEAFAVANPKNTAEKALVVAAYLQASKGGVDVSGREINKELTQIGHGVRNITRAVEPLIKKKPQFLIQTRKEGLTRQAQKKYRVTNEGFTFVKRLINRVAEIP